MIRGQDIFKIEIWDGLLRNSRNNILNYDFRSFYRMWKGYHHNLGYGSGYYFHLNFEPTDNLSFSFQGSELASSLTWVGIDEYYGTINLDIYRPDADGINYLHPQCGVILT